MENTEKFQITIDEKVFNCEIDEKKHVWIIELDGSRTTYGQNHKVENIEDAKEVAKLIVYASNKINKE